MTPDADKLAAAFAKLKRIRRPPVPKLLSADLRPVWRHLAPQVASFSAVTKLDMDALEMLIAVAHDTQRAFDVELPAAYRRRWHYARRRYRAQLWELCQAFLLGPEVLEEITMPDGETLAALIGGRRSKK